MLREVVKLIRNDSGKENYIDNFWTVILLNTELAFLLAKSLVQSRMSAQRGTDLCHSRQFARNCNKGEALIRLDQTKALDMADHH